MPANVVYRWESLPEYVATQQFSRCLGRILASLPRRRRRAVERRLVRGAVAIGTGISGANAEDAPGGFLLPARERERFRLRALGGVAVCRGELSRFCDEGVGSRPDILSALELLERIEASILASAGLGLPP